MDIIQIDLSRLDETQLEDLRDILIDVNDYEMQNIANEVQIYIEANY